MAGRKSEAARAEGKTGGVRGDLQADLEKNYALILSVLEDALQSTKRVRVQRECLKCGCKHIEFAEVVNVEAALKAAEFFANQALGRPGEDQSGKGGGDFVVHRHVVEPEEADGDPVGLPSDSAASSVPEV